MSISACAICGSTEHLWLTYPYLGNPIKGEKLCPEHYKLYVEHHEEFKKLTAETKKKGRK